MDPIQSEMLIMRDLGFNYLVIDDGWMAKNRDSNGNLVASQHILHLTDYGNLLALVIGTIQICFRLVT